MREIDLDLAFEEDLEGEEWFCDDCNMGPIDAEKSKCPRCGFKLKHHYEAEQEMDENGDPIDIEEYHKHY